MPESEYSRKMKKMPGSFCPICGKPPDEKAVCPNCGLDNICGYHLYRFYSDRADSPLGCTKCGPRCASCNAQTVLREYEGRALCSNCFSIAASAENLKKQQMKENMEKMQNALASFLLVVCFFAGVYLGLQKPYQDIISDLVKIKLPVPLLIGAWSVIGIAVGTIVSGILKSLKF